LPDDKKKWAELIENARPSGGRGRKFKSSAWRVTNQDISRSRLFGIWGDTCLKNKWGYRQGYFNIPLNMYSLIFSQLL
jgi:hypothetical protein